MIESIPFSDMRVQKVVENNNKVNLEANFFGQGLFPRIRDLELLIAINQQGTAKVMIEEHGSGSQVIFYECITTLTEIDFED